MLVELIFKKRFLSPRRSMRLYERLLIVCINAKIDRQKGGQMGRWMYGRTDGWMDRWKNKRTNGRTLQNQRVHKLNFLHPAQISLLDTDRKNLLYYFVLSVLFGFFYH